MTTCHHTLLPVYEGAIDYKRLASGILLGIPEAGTSLKIENHPIEIIQTRGPDSKNGELFPGLPQKY